MLRLNSTERLQFVWREDPALKNVMLDMAGAPDETQYWWDEYEKTGDVSHLKVKDGQKVTVFGCDRLSRKDYLKFTSRPTDQSMYSCEEIFARCVKSVVNLEAADGSPFHLEFAGDMLTDDCRERLFSPSLVSAAGTFILSHSKLDPTRGQA